MEAQKLIKLKKKAKLHEQKMNRLEGKRDSVNSRLEEKGLTSKKEIIMKLEKLARKSKKRRASLKRGIEKLNNYDWD